MRVYRRKTGGVWWVYFTTPEGKEVRKSTKQIERKRADAVAKRLEREACDPTYAASRATTVADALTRLYEEVERRGRASGTLNMHRTKGGHIARLLKPDTPLAHVDARRVDEYIATRKREGAGTNTIYKELVTLRSMLKVARRRGEYDRELSQVMPVAFASGYKPRKRWLTRAQVAAVLEHLPPDVGAWLCAAVGTAARLAELGRLRREDIDLEAGSVRIRGTKTAGSARTIPALTLTRPYLERALRDGSPGSKLLPTWGRVRPILDRALLAAKLGHYSPNDLRRSLSKWLKNAGVPAALIADILGHEDTRMVERVYGRTDPGVLGPLVEGYLRAPPRCLKKHRGMQFEACTADVREPLLSPLPSEPLGARCEPEISE